MAITKKQTASKISQSDVVSKVKVLGVFSLTMISVGSVLSARNFPTMVEYGWSSIGWYLFGAIFFLLPLTLVSAELATGWHEEGGGVYSWVKAAFGEKSGFTAIFCEWSNNLVWFPTVLSFIAGSFAYALNPKLAENGWFMFVVMMVAFWGSTGMAFFGSKVTSKFNNFGVVLGSLLPCALLVILGIVFLAGGDHSEIGAFELKKIVPSIKVSDVAFMSSVILIFAGMEMSGFHALEVKNPKKDYPKAMFTAAGIIILITILGTLALAWVVPKDSASLSAGLMQAFSIFFKTFHISWLVRPMAILITLGGLALMMNYLVGPILGMRATASDGNMPAVVAKQNKRGVPTPMLITQGLITTAVSLLFVFMKSVNEAYWILSAMTTAVLCVMYLFIFASVIILRFKAPDVERAFKIPGGKPGVFIIAGLGFLATSFTFVVCFLPTSLSSASISFGKYIIIFIIGVAILTLPPVVYLKLRKN